MSGNPGLGALSFGISKMPAADPEVYIAAQELVRDPQAYFERRREADLEQVRETLDRRAAKLVEQLTERDRERRRQRFRQLFGWVLRKRR